MTLDEALAELGIEPSATSDEARRAYLRGIKTRKPETDPEGFRRLREAYELVSAALAEPAEDSIPALRIEWREEQAEEEGAPELAALSARMAELPAESHWTERIATLRQAILDHPRSAGVRWWLIEELDEDGGRAEEVLEALREGEAAGLPDFLETRAVRFPASVDGDDVARLEASPDPNILAIAAWVHLEHSRPEEAAATLYRAIDRLPLTEAYHRASGPIPIWLPRALLGLEGAGEATVARALHGRLWNWLQGTGDADLLRSWGADTAWALAHELGLLDPAFPAELRRSAAQAVLRKKTQAEALAAAKLLAKRHPKQAEQASELLYDLPGLYGLYFRALQGIDSEGRPQAALSMSTASTLGRLLPFLLLALFRLPFSCPSHDAVVRPAAETGVQEEALSPEAMSARAAGTWGILNGACDRVPPDLPRNACDAARRAVQRAESADCEGAHQALGEMKAGLRGLTVPSMASAGLFQVNMLAILSAGCKASGSKPGARTPS